MVTRLAPERADAWLRLGCRKYAGRWVSEPQAAAERAESDAQRQADVRWGPRLKQWWLAWLADKDHRAEAEETLAEALEPRAVPSIQKLFASGTPDQQVVAVRLLRHIDSAEASRGLAQLAAKGRSSEVRALASLSLTRRDPNEAIDPLIKLMRTPMIVDVTPGQGPNAVSTLRVEDEQAILNKVYKQRTVRIPAVAAAPTRPNPFGFILAAVPPRRNQTTQQQLQRDVRTFQARNSSREDVNTSARIALTQITGHDLGPDPDTWRLLVDGPARLRVRPRHSAQESLQSHL